MPILLLALRPLGYGTAVQDCVLLVDVFDDFSHNEGRRLLASFGSAARGIAGLLAWGRSTGMPVVYANDTFGIWTGNSQEIVERARDGPGGDLVELLVPGPEDAFVVKPRYSAFDHTPLRIVLERLGTERILLGGMATERCVAQTAIDAKEEGLKVTVVTSACASVDSELSRVALTYLERVVGAFVVERAEQAQPVGSAS